MSGSPSPDQLFQPMVDPFGRTIRYLRVSVTDRCDLRCFYCMSEDMTFLPKADLLTLEELDRLCSAFIAKGVRKVRLTGGEPLVRRNVMSLVRSLSRHLSTGPLCQGGRNRRQARLHHADDAQFLRILQPGADHLHRHAAHLSRPGRCLR